ncbi:probable glycosyltransferase At5g03795 [Phragmites australis]|uniref:probable glycosyltransferase At5g03795 n=1 Tax=Phragmites australis TaxID=29695 RepID=UPI002D7A2420|nr:probable glycosyltransferase At5g03795 [Phragmites australis]
MRATGATSASAAPCSTMPCLHGQGHAGRAAAYAVAACLALVTFLMVVSLDPGTQAASWFLSSSSSSPSSSSLQPSGGGGGGGHLLATSSSYSDGGDGGRNSTGKEVNEEVLFQQQGGDDLLSLINSSSGHGTPDLSVTPPPAAPAPAPEPAKESSNDATHVMPQVRRRDVKLERLELGLAKARSAIMEAIRNKDNRPPLIDKDYVPVGPVYRNAYAFHRSYREMENLFKIYVYEEGEPPVFHDGPCRSIYSTEGRFIYSMEMESRMCTRDPGLAHVFFLPFSVVKMVKMIYEPSSHDMGPLRRTISDYVGVLSTKYPYWNRSLGADHFMLSCHDWGPYVSSANGHLFANSIRVLCNANTSEGFNPSKDVSLPEINLRSDVVDKQVGGPSASHRPILAFFAGGNHGPVRPLLLEHWKGKDPDVQVSEYLPRGVSYTDMMRRSRFCLCPGGYEVASPRLAEAIYLECVPVVVDDGDYALPFGDVLNWAAFSVRVRVADIPRLKEILAAVSPRQYIRMQRRVRTVRRHFLVHGGAPRRYDVFHMILHSVWLRRLNVRVIAQG